MNRTGYLRQTKSESNLPNGSVFLKVLENKRSDTTGIYELFMSIFGPAVTTAKYLKSKIENGVKWSDAVSVSDEAFISLALLNYWNSWVSDDLKIKDDPIYPLDKAVWSTAGRGTNWKQYVGWDKAALKKFVTITEEVQADREADLRQSEKFDANLRLEVIKTMSAKCRQKLARDSDRRRLEESTGDDSLETVEQSAFASLYDDLE